MELKGQHFAGDATCSAWLKSRNAPCGNLSYFLCDDGALLCGVHAKRKTVTALGKNPNKQALTYQKLRRERAAIEAAAEENLQAGRRGNIIVTKLRMMRAPEDHAGYMKLFPNNRHGGRKDGLGLPSLSPMRLGPVEHGQPGLPAAMTIEGLHQANKAFPSEVDDDGEPTEEWAALQLEMYRSTTPSRHKDAARTGNGAANAPLYSVWVQRDGERKRVSYVESRQFYCGFYERLVNAPASLAAEDFDALRGCLNAGYNLQIVGYDARPVTVSLEEMYLDPSAPFGHELVLYTMLALDNPDSYPWRIHKTEVF
jgi:hypothetical protein